jgi:N utilization substance protein A
VNRDFIGALLQLNAEKGVPREQLVRTVEDAIQSAYRRVAAGNEDVHVRLDIETGRMRVFRAREVVYEVEDPTTQWSLDEAREHSKDARVGDLLEYEELDPEHFGRVGAQIAGQVIRQRLREAERETLFDEFAHREGEIITGSVSRVEPRGVILDLGKAEAVLPSTDQSATEHYRIGQHVKAFVMEVRRTTRGPLIYVSRTHKSFLRRLFELEVPEIHAGTVEIKAIAREAGSRSKVAVASRQEGLDPVGATVGQRGGRVQAVVAELAGEKIDVIPWSDDPAVFVANALSPAQVVGVDIDEGNRIASVTVPERMLSLAIGREGQNARLAAKLTGWRIDIRSDQAPPRGEGAPPEPRRAGRPASPAEPVAATRPVGGEQPIADHTAADPTTTPPERAATVDLPEAPPPASAPGTSAESPAVSKPRASSRRTKPSAAETEDASAEAAARQPATQEVEPLSVPPGPTDRPAVEPAPSPRRAKRAVAATEVSS